MRERIEVRLRKSARAKPPAVAAPAHDLGPAPPLPTAASRAKRRAPEADAGPPAKRRAPAKRVWRGPGGAILFQADFPCHRSAPPKASRAKAHRARQHSKKAVACPFFLRYTVYKDRPNIVVATEHNGHYRHIPGSAEDLRWQPLRADVRRGLVHFLKAGLSPAAALVAFQREARDAGALDKVGAAGARMVTLAQVQTLQSNVAAETRVDQNDARSVDAMVKELGDGVVLFYANPGLDGSDKAGFRLALMPEFGRRMLASFGGAGRLIFLDGVWGMTAYGYVTLTLVVRDEWGHHCPVAACIADSEKAEVVEQFLRVALERAGLEPNDCTFMIDKSVAEIAAIKALGAHHLLCFFHFLQEADRSLKTVECGIAGKDAGGLRHAVVQRLILLQRVKTEALFQAANASFRRWLVSKKMPKVEDWYAKNWEPDAPYWAAFGRVHVAAMMSDTNNLIESYHHQLKYVHARGRRCGRMDDFVKLMCHTVWPAYIACRESRVLEAERSRAERADEVHDHAVDYLTTAYGALEVVDEALGAGSCVAEVHNAGELVPPHVAFVVDCSCQCAVSRKDVCVHTEALAQRCPLNLEMMRLGAEEIERRGLAKIADGTLGAEGLFCVAPLAREDPRAAGAGADFHVDVAASFCSCHAFRLCGDLCCHLLAVAPDDARVRAAVKRLEALDESTSNGSVVAVTRQRRVGEPPKEEPTTGLDRNQLEVGVLTAPAAPSTVREARALIASGTAGINRLAKVISSSARLVALASKVQELLAEAKAAVPHLVPTSRRAAQKANAAAKRKFVGGEQRRAVRAARRAAAAAVPRRAARPAAPPALKKASGANNSFSLGKRQSRHEITALRR